MTLAWTQMTQQPNGAHWMENVNILLIRPNQSLSSPSLNSLYDYEVCSIESTKLSYVDERNVRSAIDGSRTITPGKRRHLPAANLHESDFAPEWRSVLGAAVVHRFENSKTNDATTTTTSKVNILSEHNTIRKSALDKLASNCGKILKTQLALRICAIRCLFQELGLLLCNSRGNRAEPWNLGKWQSQVRRDAAEFIKLFQVEPGLRPAVEQLYEWWNWLTPATIGRSPRYDTLFYLCPIESWTSSRNLFQVTDTRSVVVTNGSSSTSQDLNGIESMVHWSALNDLLQSYEHRHFLLSPCQLYELVRLASHRSLQSVKQFATEREPKGVQQWIPFISLYKNGTISYLPGDEYYPAKVELTPTRTPPMDDGMTIEQMRERRKDTQSRVNRIEHLGYWCRIVVDDLPGPAGHSPIRHNQLPVVQITNNNNSGADDSMSTNIAKL